MSLLPILVICSFSIAIGLLARGRWRAWSLLVVSILAIYWLQPSTPIRHLDFWLPTLSISFAMIVWAATAQKDHVFIREDVFTAGVIASVIILIGIPRYIDKLCCLTPSPPPPLPQILIAILVIALLLVLISRSPGGKNVWLYGISAIILLLLIVMKFEPLAQLASMGIRSATKQSVQLASGFDIRWLGFSYVAFRLLHALIDRINKRLPELRLQEFIIYIIFYPSISAGPIDRVQRFTHDLHKEYSPSPLGFLSSGKRILVGIFRKFVLADGLALIALNDLNSSQVQSMGWLWILLYAYTFRIYFDFSGYTDIAIGIGSLVGIQLPENFDKPYLKRNLTLFWNSWHMTLAGWFRAYYFNPMTRKIRAAPRALPLPVIIFIGQFTTFVLIGLWHGFTWNFAIWGAWHGFGIFIHNRYTEFLRSRNSISDQAQWLNKLGAIASTFLTFHYVSLGWVWFALTSPIESWQILLRLFGIQ